MGEEERSDSPALTPLHLYTFTPLRLNTLAPLRLFTIFAQFLKY